MSIPHLFSAQPQSFLQFFVLFCFLLDVKPLSPLQDILYEEQPHAKCPCGVNEEIDLGKNQLRGRDCPQETAASLFFK